MGGSRRGSNCGPPTHALPRRSDMSSAMTAADSSRCLRTSPSRISMRPSVPRERLDGARCAGACVRWLMSRTRRASSLVEALSAAKPAARSADGMTGGAVDQAHEVGAVGQPGGPCRSRSSRRAAWRRRHGQESLTGWPSCGDSAESTPSDREWAPASPSATASALRRTSDSVTPSRSRLRPERRPQAAQVNGDPIA